MKNKQNDTENKKIISQETKTQSLLDFLNLEKDEKESDNNAFVKHNITAQVSGYRFYKNDEDIIDKVQIKTAVINEENGNLIEETFTLRGKIIEKDIISLKGQHILVKNVTRYTKIERDFKGNEKSRTHTFGAELENMTVLGLKTELEPFDRNSFVEIELKSVANILKQGKAIGDVSLISVKENEDGTIQTFKCKLKSAKNQSYDKTMFEPVIGKILIINYINEIRMNGNTFYNTEIVPEVKI